MKWNNNSTNLKHYLQFEHKLQYFGAIKDRVSAYMKDLDIELWKMGIASKTKHRPEKEPLAEKYVPELRPDKDRVPG